MFQSSPTLHQRGRVIGSDSIVDGFKVSILARASSARVPDLESKLSDIAAGFQSAPALHQRGRVDQEHSRHMKESGVHDRLHHS